MILIVIAFVLNGSLTLLDPEYGVWTDAVYSSWGNQTFVTPGLSEPAWIVRDGAGTVHIYASNDASLFFAQGYSQASDRLFQMELQSLVAQGNLSSWIGPSGLASDRSFRYLGIPEAAAEIARNLPQADPSAAQLLTSYSEGVNAYISWAEARGALPLQFKVLGVQPYPWSPYDTLCFERLMVLSQTAGVTEPLDSAILAAAVGDNATNAMFPIYPPQWQNFTVLPGNGSINGVSLASEQGVTPQEVFSQDWLAPWATGIPTAEEASLIPLYRAALTNLTDPYLPGLGAAAVSEGVGSNSWVVAANKTGTGFPLLANDPHLPLQLPSLWIPTQLADPSYDVEGWALAGAPGILIGHNANLAWGLTYSGGATALDYVETLRGDSYLLNGSWYPLTWQNQTIPVLGGSPVPLDVPWTANGPLVARMGDFGLSVRWDGSGPTYELVGELLFDKAVSIAQMKGILEQYWDTPTLNFMMAEYNRTTGATHIGWIIPAHYPLVPATLPGGPTIRVIGSRAPLNGSGGWEPVGRIPPALSPQIVDPARGYLFAPNQPSVGQEFPFPMIGSWWDTGGRAHTIGTYLAQHPTMTVGNMMALQGNVTDSWSIQMAPVLEAALSTVANASGLTPGVTHSAQAAIPLLKGWAGNFNKSLDAPTVYSYWWNEILQVVDGRIANLTGVSGLPSPDPNEILSVAESDPGSSWFPGGWTNLTVEAATRALGFLVGNLGPLLPGSSGTGAPNLPAGSNWTWGRVHTFFLPSITQVPSFGEGPFPQWGDSYTPSVAPFSDAITLPLTQTVLGSSLRMVSPPTLGPSYGIIPGGTSGNIASVYYDNQLPLWLAHEYVSMSCVPSPSSQFPGGVVSTWVLQP